MIDRNELIFVVDENNNPLPPLPRNIVHENVLWHRTSGIYVLDRSKQVLCQKRSMMKDIKPGLWEALFGGHLGPNESYIHNAAMETSEELGIEVNEKDLIPYKILKSDEPTHKEFQHIFALVLNNQHEFKFEKEEVDQLSWQDINKLKEILVNKKHDQWVKKPWDEEILIWLSFL